MNNPHKLPDIDRKYSILDSMTGGGVFNPEVAELELEAYVQARQAKLREALRRMVSSFDRLLTISESHGILSRESATSFAATSAHGHNALAEREGET